MPPELKIILYVSFVVSLFLLQNPVAYGFIFIVILILCLRMPFASIKKGWMPVSLFLFFTFFSNLFFSHGKILYSFGSAVITDEGLRSAATRTMRIFFMVMGAKILTASTSLEVLVGALNKALKPLEKIGLPIGEFFSVMGLTLRCFPKLKEHLSENYKNYKDRGDNDGFLKKAKIISSFLLPMFVQGMQSPEIFFDPDIKNGKI